MNDGIMSLTDRLSVLRDLNKKLLAELRQERERLRRFDSRVAEATENGEPEGKASVDRAPRRKPAVTFEENGTVIQDTRTRRTATKPDVSPPPATATHCQETADHLVPSELQDRLAPVTGLPRERKSFDRSSFLDQRHSQADVRVTFHSPELEEMSPSDRHLQPLLGYDWIAGVLDVESSVVERSEDFFHDLRAFRSINKDECVNSCQAQSLEDHSLQPLVTGKDDAEANVGTHQCTFCYRINSRLFPIPLDPQECCPVCKKPKFSIPHTNTEPAFIRVTIPHAALMPAYEYKAHRRCSFDPSDSFGLPSHCLLGWSNTSQTAVLQPSSLDLRSNVNIRTSIEKDSDIPVPEASGCRRSEQIQDVSCLARYHLQHLSPKSRLRHTANTAPSQSPG